MGVTRVSVTNGASDLVGLRRTEVARITGSYALERAGLLGWVIVSAMCRRL